MLLRVIHHTQYIYQVPVMLAQHLAHLQPLQTDGQQLLRHQTAILPVPAQRQDTSDAFGNQRTFFALQSPHEQLDVISDSLLQTRRSAPLPASPAWEDVQQAYQYHAGQPYEPSSEFRFASPFVVIDDTFTEFARPDFTPRRPLLAACEALMNRIHMELRYESQSTEIHTPALQALAQRKGVCQDFAHIMLGCLRSLGLAARYVSGYLLTQPPPGKERLVGADASHAWVSVACEGKWYDFDPTNQRCGYPSPGEDYVTVAIGRDFGDVSPLRGVIQGGGSHELSVAVTVAPADQFERLVPGLQLITASAASGQPLPRIKSKPATAE